MPNPYLVQYFATRRRLKLVLALSGAVAGAIVGVSLTLLGKALAGAPPAPLSEYLWNVMWFAGFGVVFSPVVIWTALRRVPLWRTIVEPLVAGLALTAIGMVAGSPILLLAGAPIGIGAAVARLSFSHRDAATSRSHSPPPS